MTWLQPAALVAVLLALPSSSTARPRVMVGLFLGINRIDPDGYRDNPDALRLRPLSHAEEEAEALLQQFVATEALAPERATLLLAPTRAEFWVEVQETEDRLDDVRSTRDTVLLVYFSGHGQHGKLLLRDGPLLLTELHRAVRQIGADLTVVVIDACYSGGLLRSKGGRVAPPPLGPPPPDVRTSGTIYLLSSGPDQESYEDPEYGGLFSHYLREGLVNLCEQRPEGVTLDQLFEYAYVRTRARAQRMGQWQEPVRYSQLIASDLLYVCGPRIEPETGPPGWLALLGKGESDPALLLGLQYQVQIEGGETLLPGQVLATAIRFETRRFTAGAQVGYGFGTRELGVWESSVQSVSAQFQGGIGGQFKYFRGSAEVVLGGFHAWQTAVQSPYPDLRRQGFGVQTGGVLHVLFLPNDTIGTGVQLGAGVGWLPGAAAHSDHLRTGWFSLAGAVMMRL